MDAQVLFHQQKDNDTIRMPLPLGEEGITFADCPQTLSTDPHLALPMKFMKVLDTQ